MKTIPFDASKVKSGDEVIINKVSKAFFIGTKRDGGIITENEYGDTLTWWGDQVSLIDTTPPRMIPHDMESFDRDGWFRRSDLGYSRGERICAIQEEGVFFSHDNVIKSFRQMLVNWLQVHPDGTTSPCGRIADESGSVTTKRVEREEGV